MGRDGGRGESAGGRKAAPREVPEEIDDHYRMYGKEPWEIDYGEKCPVCGSRTDEYGLCACDSGGD